MIRSSLITKRLCLNCNASLMFTKKDHNRIPKKYCNNACRYEFRKKSGYHKMWYEKKHPEIFERECLICERNIKAQGKRKIVSKYCSKKCMYLAERIRNTNLKYITVKIPVGYYPKIVNKRK